MIDEYCERHVPGLFEEPFNTMSNLVFIWAAVQAWNLAGRHSVRTWDSSPHHSLGNSRHRKCNLAHVCNAMGKTRRLDPHSPVSALVSVAVLADMRRSEGCFCDRPVVRIPGVSILMMKVPPWLNGSILYAPTMFVLLCLAAYHYMTRQPDRWLLALIAILFCVALTFRSIDSVACVWMPFGTHFLWHLFNGALFYCAMRAIILKRVNQSTAAIILTKLYLPWVLSL